ncbi:MAG: FtsK/SpoIIIE domain-containing protein [Gemmatales bacterium]|nr:FtsK/SpoIIIE domain-containing protein [Gemmatales bacterium]MDW8221713.1 FtsK/SpoIIIE domain-containing protein [Gemmatales bacterium]
MSATLTESCSTASMDTLLDQERHLLQQLRELISWRVHTEQEIEGQYRQRLETIEAERRRRLPDLERNYQQQRHQLESYLREQLTALEAHQQEEQARISADWECRRASCQQRAEQERAQLDESFQQQKWELQTSYEASATDLENRARDLELKLQAESARIRNIRQESRELLTRWRQSPDKVAVTRRTFAPDEDLIAIIQEKAAEAKQYLELLRQLVLPRLFEGRRFWWIILLSTVLLLPASLLVTALGLTGNALAWWKDTTFWSNHGVTAAAVIAIALTLPNVLILPGLYMLARWRVNQFYRPLLAAIYEATKAGQLCVERHQEEQRRQAAELKARRQQYETQIKELTVRYRRQVAELEVQSQRDLQLLDEQFQRQLARFHQEIERNRQQVTEDVQNRLAELENYYQTTRTEIENRYERDRNELEAWHQRRWNELRRQWADTLQRLTDSAQQLRDAAYSACPPWSDSFWLNWQARTQPPAYVPLGLFRVSLRDWPDALPEDAEMRSVTPEELVLPAALEFPHRCSLMIRLPHAVATPESARGAAIRLMQMYLFRLAATLPPGKVRFTIIDPVGLGESFSALMHLADYDELLVTSRIWTEPQHIEQRLADLTAHMETVFQKYLRNQFATLEEYNQQAGELAEPYRILVVADFPANFTSEAARRLASIITSGPRCGVYTVVGVDLRQTMPHGFQLEDLERVGTIFAWRQDRLVWQDADFASMPLHFDPPPPDELANRVLHRIGPAALAAKRVEVPFRWVAPPREKWWSFDAGAGLEIPIGRCGATKRQFFRLGRGTAQHALVAGKTGSGKSTLFHVLITNLALYYSPEEVELYLVDFKKGVEFKTYANHQLPHARVIAIESEREFGLSVLQRLDAELRRRGELFRQAAVQDLPSYRQATGQKLPRILLLVDEFQEFFIEDDRLAQEAALLLDRLVRQGRAFGLHVVLGSQTLGGAYTLARSTLDQMAVRIALQCSEADSSLILSEDNTAARLLNRPGEAIYNDANGLVEGNSPFQIVWLDDDTREHYLQEIQQLARRRRLAPQPQVVFEGNAPSELGRNVELARFLTRQLPPTTTPTIWLGDSIAIQEPTHFVLHRQAGANVVVVGQDEMLAAGMFCASLICLAAQLPVAAGAVARSSPAAARIYFLDGSLENTPAAVGLAATLAALPQPTRVGRWRDSARFLQELQAELQRRISDSDASFPPWFLFIFALHRFRDLRRQEEEYGFSFDSSKPASPTQILAELLREGPALGIHTFLWCDTLTNLQRSLDRAALRELNLRIALQMSANDSSNLLDSPLASRLGSYRAYLFTEEQGKLEKFRPYGLPDANFLHELAERLAALSA